MQKSHDDVAGWCHGQEAPMYFIFIFFFAEQNATLLGGRSIKFQPVSTSSSVMEGMHYTSSPSEFLRISPQIFTTEREKSQSVLNESIQDNTWPVVRVDQTVYAFSNHCHLSFLISIHVIKLLTSEVY